mmetsp:Transcript_23943/g.34438  ORF Transcript_23943/g.34438 Transcript_23943/m.34438 type:complete len:88 (+) Transcript_23943:2501-2764(+)
MTQNCMRDSQTLGSFYYELLISHMLILAISLAIYMDVLFSRRTRAPYAILRCKQWIEHGFSDRIVDQGIVQIPQLMSKDANMCPFQR